MKATLMPLLMNRRKVFLKTLFEYRFTLLLIALIIYILLPSLWNEPTSHSFLLPALRTLLLIACLNIIQKMRRFLIFIAILGLLAASADWIAQELVSFSLFALFIGVITFELFNQILHTREITLEIIIAALNGYLLLGVIGSTMFFFIHMVYPDSFMHVAEGRKGFSDLIYFSYTTLTTIGFGDITPLNDSAKRVAVLLGLLGQFYLAVVMAVLVGKYISRTKMR